MGLVRGGWGLGGLLLLLRDDELVRVRDCICYCGDGDKSCFCIYSFQARLPGYVSRVSNGIMMMKSCLVFSWRTVLEVMNLGVTDNRLTWRFPFG